MTWEIVMLTMCLIGAAVAALLWKFAGNDKARLRGKIVTLGALGAAVLFFLMGCFTIVGTRQIAIVTTFGRPNGVSLNNGFHGKWPWQMTHQMDGAVQIDKYVKEGSSDQRITVRLGNQSTALADVSIRWQLKQSAAPELFQQYKTFDNVRVNLIERNLSVALNEVFAAFNPLDPQNLDVSPLPNLAKRAADIMRQDVGGQVDIFDVNVPTIQYDQGTEDKINQLNQQRAQTSIAVEAQRTAEAQAKANEILSRSISNDPNVVVQNCITAAINKGISPLGCWPGSSALPTVSVPPGR
ncbi:SPFH domain-containing protein [Mycobacterium marinum]|uniref:SPFH domain / Band 7 family protein n=1 Tax=Mycobacterium marinum TaxID=1781 RepID=A0A3E2MPY5_MYCMR|nr:SPFH domain-containing protein [Mycobacterium marinum]MDC8981746.1 SPFH domain-containing protein [Mycobacterium marinum]MDC8993189.1 SPFH domain-containing protein [Mycobacterium marinum]MDC8998207.1 SPFH domain-containing protein [Mycobacterium marinum]MDC9009468.1 SPFH domain-containing protein [Mycobacterium marinum]MDC9014336.1 SPFH domain-containing protein [Mycobacterium marinum]